MSGTKITHILEANMGPVWETYKSQSFESQSFPVWETYKSQSYSNPYGPQMECPYHAQSPGSR